METNLVTARAAAKGRTPRIQKRHAIWNPTIAVTRGHANINPIRKTNTLPAQIQPLVYTQMPMITDSDAVNPKARGNQ